MTLEEYEKVLEEKRKALQALKTEERKVDTKEFESLQQLSNKKGNDDVFIKLVRTADPFVHLVNLISTYYLILLPELFSSQGSEKDKKKESAEKEEKAKKVLLLIMSVIETIYFF